MKETASGPVTAKVTVSPAKPRLGDSLTLELVVEAEAGVEVRMPAFGEALGRFAIVDFVPRRRTSPAGGTVASQRYTLDPPMSGAQKIPSLLVEFVDGRPGQTGDAGATAGEVSELLTDEVTIEVASVLDGDEPLRPARAALPVDTGTGLGGWPLVAAGVALVVIVFGLLVARSRRRRRPAEDPLIVALRRLAALEARGVPSPAEADAWYVELSDIVRHYLEDRFSLRAPEQTTEEFLREIGRSDTLSPEHRALLGTFLERCDRVKFAAYQPREHESREALAAARRFVDETRDRTGEVAA